MSEVGLFFFFSFFLIRALTFFRLFSKVVFGEKNEVSLTDNFYSLTGVYHQYAFKYKTLRKYIQLFKSYSTK